VIAQCGRLDIVVNNAGINIRKAPHVLTLAEWRQVIDTNHQCYLCSHAAPEMKRAGGAEIINSGSMSIFGAAYAPAYAASKGGIVQFTKACAAAWAADNIQVNAILPGWIDTELTRRAHPGRDCTRACSSARGARWARRDFRGIAVFLAGAASDFITGAAITVDGGYSIQG
jgi:2-deoxy-D-gluconate 3-dehydrogenase